MRKRVQDRQLHAWYAELCNDAAIHELHKGVHDTLWVHDDFDAIVWQTEQEMRLDHLERLVRERRAVDGDFSAHAPGGMPQGVVHGRVAERVGRPLTKGSTRRGNDQPSDVRRRAAGQTLQYGTVLAVDGNDL